MKNAMTPPTPRHSVVPHATRVPPPRPGVRHVRVPRVGMIISDDLLRGRVDRFFYWPMIVLALLMLPLLAIEFFIQPVRFSLAWWLNVTALFVIWLAFLIEFVVKITIAECRIEYVRRNWLDIVIIVMPALRPLRSIQTLRLTKTIRVFTLRGVGMKFARYVFTIVIGLEATERLLRRVGLKARSERKDPAKMTRHELTAEVKRLRRLVDAWEQWHEAHEAHVREHGGACLVQLTPIEEVVLAVPRSEGEHEQRAEPQREREGLSAEPGAG